MINLLLFILAALLAEIVGTVGGFGSSVFFVPLAQFFLGFKTVLGITAVFHLFSNTAKLLFFRNKIDWRVLFLIGVPAVIFVLIGSYITVSVNSEYTKLGLGIFLILFSVVFLVFKNFEIKASNRNALLGGGISGFLAGLIGTGGAIRGATMVAFNLDKNIFVATSAGIDLGVDFSRAVIYLYNGFLDPMYYKYIPVLIAVAFAGSYLGKMLLDRIPQSVFRILVLLLLLFIGVVMVIQFWVS